MTDEASRRARFSREHIKHLREVEVRQLTGEGWSQRQLARALGLSSGAIAGYESEKRPKGYLLPRLELFERGLQMTRQRKRWTRAMEEGGKEMWTRRIGAMVHYAHGRTHQGVFIPTDFGVMTVDDWPLPGDMANGDQLAS